MYVKEAESFRAHGNCPRNILDSKEDISVCLSAAGLTMTSTPTSVQTYKRPILRWVPIANLKLLGFTRCHPLIPNLSSVSPCGLSSADDTVATSH